MIARFEPHFAILPEPQKRLWPELAAAPGLGFVLYGGTAIALRLGHRQSVDFDFFTDRALDKEELTKAFAFMKRARFLQDQSDTLTVDVPDEAGSGAHVKVSFFGGIGFGRYAAPQLTHDGILQVAALDDLMATKLKVLLQRVEYKDYRDIAAMLEARAPLDRALAIAQAMFGNQFQPSESLKALTYFEGGNLALLTKAEKQALIQQAKAVRRLPVGIERASATLAI